MDQMVLREAMPQMEAQEEMGLDQGPAWVVGREILS